MTSKRIEKFITNAGMMAIIGIINVAIYILLKHNNPSARFTKLLGFPSFAIFFETTLRPDMQRELSSL
jgi:hypothetical protein